MRQLKNGTYKASNFCYIPSTAQAWSYDWWKISELRKNKIIFNDYPYSVSTRRHQRLAMDLIRTNYPDIEIVRLPTPKGLQSFDARTSCVDHLTAKILLLRIKIMTGKKEKNLERRAEIKTLEKQIKLARKYL
jgi:hypothetical protein